MGLNEDVDRILSTDEPNRVSDGSPSVAPDSFPAPIEVDLARNEFPDPIPASELGGGESSIGSTDDGSVLVIADPEVGEVLEVHLDRAFLTERLEVPAAGAAPGEVTVRGWPDAGRSCRRASPRVS